VKQPVVRTLFPDVVEKRVGRTDICLTNGGMPDMNQRDARRWMWSEAVQMLQEADRLNRQFFQVGARQLSCPAWEPPLDVYETHDGLVLQFALPGVVAGQLEVGIEGSVLSVRGERPHPAAMRDAAIRRLEIPYGRFERRVMLPAGRYQLVRNDLADGCLVIALNRVG
jgi:HSP20 family molecular chaperone IbpA